MCVGNRNAVVPMPTEVSTAYELAAHRPPTYVGSFNHVKADMIFPCWVTRRRGTLALVCLLPLAGPGCDRGNDQAATRASTLTVLDRERTGPSRFVFLQMGSSLLGQQSIYLKH